MKIAYIVPYVPNLIRTRPYNLITQLSALGVDVTVFTLVTNGQDLTDAETLRSKGVEVRHHVQPVWRSLWNSALAVPSRQPLQAVYSWQGELAERISERISQNEFDVIHVEHLRGSRYGTFLKSKFPAVPVVWDSVDCISHLFRQASAQSRNFFGKFITRFDLPRTERAEGNLICAFDRVLVTSPADQNALLKLTPLGKHASRVSVLPNGVDLEYFYPNPEIQRDPETILFSGKMSYHANIAMVRYLISDVLPRIWETRPTVRLCIVGKDPPSDIKELEKDQRITVTGTVDDIRPYLWCATVSVVPLLYGAGIQNKILEAMATGTPVVTTSRALSALQAEAGQDLLVADTADDFARAVLHLMNDLDLRMKVGGAGAFYVRTHHNWSSVSARLADIYQELLDHSRLSINPTL
jgi:glycosyltransferase involved in cell wall biosynthesis